MRFVKLNFGAIISSRPFPKISLTLFFLIELKRTEKCFSNFQTSFNVCKYFISLGLKSRTTSFSCSKNDDDFDEDFLLRTPLPWVVRVFFEYEDSIKGTLCSGEASI